MRVIEIFLPLQDNAGNAIPKHLFDQVRGELTKQFGGVTAFVRAPAIGLWEDQSGAIRRDEIVVFEVMSDSLDREFWTAFRDRMERAFRQKEVMIRASNVDRL